MKRISLLLLTLMVSIASFAWSDELILAVETNGTNWDEIKLTKGKEINNEREYQALFRVEKENPKMNIHDGDTYWQKNSSNNYGKLNPGNDYWTSISGTPIESENMKVGCYAAFFTPRNENSKLYIVNINKSFTSMKLGIANSSNKWTEFDMTIHDDNKSEYDVEYTCTFTLTEKGTKLSLAGNFDGMSAYWRANETAKAGDTYVTFLQSGESSCDLAPGTYVVYFRPRDNHLNIQVKSGGNTPTDGSYYFYGDMNLWSSKELCEQKVKAYTDNSQTNDVADKIFGSAQNVPTYLTEDELENDWKFKKVSDATDTKYETYLTGHGVASSDVKDWYYIDFKNLVDGEGHRGRLCGQFKVTMGDHSDGNNWGISGGGYNTTYYEKAIVAGDTKPFSVDKGTYKQNMQLEANYVKDAVLYFNPDGHVLVEGTPIYNYVYYAVINGTPSASAIKKCELIKDNQENYYVNFDGFNSSSITSNEAKTGGNPKLGYYGWEEVTAINGTLDANNGSKYLVNGKIVYDGVEFSTVLRRRIPSGATHRFPISLTVEFADQDFSATEPVHCDDIWFINATKAGDVDVYFRYNDDDATENLGWVAYNIFNKVYKANVPDGYNYLFGGQRAIDGPQPRISDGEYGMLTKVKKQAPGDTKERTWWKSPKKVPAEFATSSWVIFGESRGGVFPAERVNASNIDLEDVAMHGTDLYYVANANENPGLLYSHLNGTYVLSDHDQPTDAIQINAEMFDPETTGDPSVSPRLLTDIREVTYRYEIWNEGDLVVHSCRNNINEDATIDADGFTSQPYFNWYVNGTENANGDVKTFKTGYYFIVVKAKYKNKVYTAQDTYAIY